ncbi:hypothetical protein [Saccharopolyspora cebuensis]|uniref:Uncharacterized protein n=2 Tax=Pseudonocardiales TaxID=85010 RepID=A0ABV4CN32_9PSEU
MSTSDHSGRHSAETMEEPTVPFFAFERALLATPTEELPAVLNDEPQWPTVDMDDPDIKEERHRAAEVAFQRTEPERAPQQRTGQWQPPMTGDELAHMLELMRKKWNM